MKNALSIMAMLCCLIAVYSGEGGDKELARLQGSWTTESLVYDGKDFSEKIKIRFVFKGNQAVVEGNDAVKKEYARLTFKLDPSTKPPIMDIKVADGTQKDFVFEGIYELKEGVLRMCAKVIGNDRPAEFAAPQGSGQALLVLKKEP